MRAEFNNKKADPSKLLKELKSIVFGPDEKVAIALTREEYPKVKFNAARFDEIVVNLLSIVEFNKAVSKSVKKDILEESIFEISSENKIVAGYLLETISKKAESYLNREEKRYVIPTYLSVKRPSSLKRRKIGRTYFTFSDQHRSKVRNLIKEKIDFYYQRKLPQNYTALNMFVSSRGFKEAGDIALNELDYLRSVWNLIINFKVYTRLADGLQRPVNRILAGPIYLGYEKENFGDDYFWYEPNFKKYFRAFNKLSTEVFEEEKKVRDKIENSPISESLKKGIILYGKALDDNDVNSCLIKLWSLIEFLTDSRNYEQASEKILFLLPDEDKHKNILKLLRSVRNEIVHEGFDASDHHIYIYQLKKYVEMLLSYLISNNKKFDDLTQVGKLLDLKKDKDKLSEEVKLFQMGIEVV